MAKFKKGDRVRVTENTGCFIKDDILILHEDDYDSLPIAIREKDGIRGATSSSSLELLSHTPDCGDGYRMLKPGDLIKKGDERINPRMNTDKWEKTCNMGNHVEPYDNESRLDYRRPVEKEDPAEMAAPKMVLSTNPGTPPGLNPWVTKWINKPEPNRTTILTAAKFIHVNQDN